ncbi:MAG: hypothetical protein K2Y39_09185 [Candidatus Obscuribacterales bacterium]|nr:hypothetical protein [Candidatus Obscuribacterales bacterium]
MRVNRTLKLFAAGTSFLAGSIAVALLVPPVRNWIFSTKMWPWPLPWDTNQQELEAIRRLSLPGDILVESNLHGWQWMALSLAATQTAWVHAALIDEKKRILTVHKSAIETDWNIYRDWGSTRLALIRPPYKNDEQRRIAIDYARGKLGTLYDPSFREHAGNCNGLVASSLTSAGIPVAERRVYGRNIFTPDCFFKIPGATVIWHSDKHRRNAL